MTDDFRPAPLDCDRTIVAAAMRLARQISKTLGTRRKRMADEAERAAVLRDAFEGVAAGVLPDVGREHRGEGPDRERDFLHGA